MSAITAPRHERQVAAPVVRDTSRFVPASVSFLGKVGAFIAVFFANIFVISVVVVATLSLLALELVFAWFVLQSLQT